MKQVIKYSILICLGIVMFQFNSYAATIVLNSGVTIKGKLINRNDEEVTIQDPYSKQLRNIKNIYIRDLVLDPDEEKLLEKIKKQKKGGVVIDRGNLLYSLQPEVGLLPGIAYPVGKMGGRIQIGYGFTAFTDLAVPLVPDLFSMRFGLSAGFLYHSTKSTDYSSSLMHIPVFAYTKLQFLTKAGLSPYIKLGGGIVPVMSGGATDVPPGVIAAVGLGYSHGKIPYLEFFIEAGYMMVFESIRGDYVTAGIGVAYRFGAPTAVTAPTGGKK